MNSRLVLLAHGSGDPNWRASFEEMASDLRADLGPGRVTLAYMEFATPTLLAAAAKAREDGVQQLKVLPLFMAGGAHVARDIPVQIRDVEACYPEMNVVLLSPVGSDPRFAALLREIARDAL